MHKPATSKSNVLTYAIYIGIAFSVIAVAVAIQFKYFYPEEAKHTFLIVPFTVATVFGIAMAKIRILQKSNQESLNSLQQEIEKNDQKDQIIYKQARFVAKSEVLQAISHHWKQPLSALSLLIQDIEDAKDFNELDEEYIKTFAEKSLKIIKGMDTTIDAFKNIFSADDLYTREFSLKEALDKTIFIIKQRLDMHNIDLVLDIKAPDAKINTYPKEFIQSIINIISNAIDALETKQNDKKIVITIYIGSDGKKVLDIYNNGDQIPQEDMDRIFDPYFSTKFDKNGTGLGLFTTKSFIENRMDGKIYVQNKDHGVSFKIVV